MVLTIPAISPSQEVASFNSKSMDDSVGEHEPPLIICRWSELVDREPRAALVADVDLVIVRYDDQVSVLYGRCPHRGAMLVDGRIDGANLICGVHDWDFRFDTGVSEYNNQERLPKFSAWVEELPRWDDLQLLTAQLARRPQEDTAEVGTALVIGPKSKKPLILKIPIFVSDMSFGALSAEAKVAMARGAELAGTGICSGEGGMLEEEHSENSRYLYELASAKFGWSLDKVKGVQAF